MGMVKKVMSMLKPDHPRVGVKIQRSFVSPPRTPLLSVWHLAELNFPYLMNTGKAQRSEDRRLSRQNTKHSGTTCFACRSKGHAAKDCPNVLLSSSVNDLLPVSGNEASENAVDGAKRKAVDEGQGKGFKRAKGKKGSDVAGTSGRCYR
jgi:hypothetical protein